MAVGLVLRMDVEQFNDATAARFYDKSVWLNHKNNITSARIVMTSDQFEGEYQIILAKSGNRTLFDDFLLNGFINIGPRGFTKVLTEEDPLPNILDETFPDGYYEFTLEVLVTGDGEVSEYTDNQGFLAFMSNEAERLKLDLPSYVMDQFITLYMYLYCAKAAASVGQISKFTKFVNYINDSINNWKVSYK